MLAAPDIGQKEIAEIFIKADADVYTQGRKYGNALRAAARRGQKETVELLIKAGADVNARGREYGNVLQAAVKAGPISRQFPSYPALL